MYRSDKTCRRGDRYESSLIVATAGLARRRRCLSSSTPRRPRQRFSDKAHTPAHPRGGRANDCFVSPKCWKSIEPPPCPPRSGLLVSDLNPEAELAGESARQSRPWGKPRAVPSRGLSTFAFL